MCRSATVTSPPYYRRPVTNLACEDRGAGDPVVFIAGRGGLGRVWHMHQVPAFQAAGYRVITFDNRGVGATENCTGFTTQSMVDETAALIEKLDAGPVRLVAVSMGSYLAQELMLARPELVNQAVLMATHGRRDFTREFFRTADLEFAESGTTLPARFDATVRLLQNFSPKTLNDEEAARNWIGMFTTFPTKPTPGFRCQIDIVPEGNRLSEYRAITTPALVIGFADDVVLPPHLAAEVADALPNGRFLNIPDAGHLGFIERPHIVNAEILKFFAEGC
jgi:pimeloyl-ACP methyl ester carboxylesterase